VPILEGFGPAPGVPGWEYKFSADNWNIQENLFSGDPCTFSAFGYTNRYINITQDTILDPVCWQSCNDCYGPQTAFNVTFRLDMSQYIGIPFSAPEINGTFNAWCGNCWPMTDINGDNIWELTTLIDTSLQEYKYSADNWNIQETLDSNLSCVFTTIDSLGNVYINRYLQIYSDTILDVVCWKECNCTNSWNCEVITGLPKNNGNCVDPGDGSGQYTTLLDCVANCISTQVAENNNDYSVYPNPTTGSLFIISKENIDMILIFNKIGKKIAHIDKPILNEEINFLGEKSGVYFVEIYKNSFVFREKVIFIR
jgi:hypothetical protein